MDFHRKRRRAGAHVWIGLVGGMAFVAGVAAFVRAGRSARESMPLPTYVPGQQLVLPADYRSWLFVGASIGLSYLGIGRRG